MLGRFIMIKLMWLQIIVTLSASHAYKILTIFPIAARSHGILGEEFNKHLLNAGHEVTAIVAIPNKNIHQNLTQVVAKSNYKVFNENSINIKAIMDNEVNFSDLPSIMHLMYNIGTTTIFDKKVQKFLRDPTQKFDLVVGELMFMEIYSTLSALYDCPFIWFSPIEPHWLIAKIIDEYPNPAYITDYFTGYSSPYSFSMRIEQLWKQISGTMTKLQFDKEEEKLYRHAIAPIIQERNKTVPAYGDLVYNVSLILGNCHVSLGLAPRLPQNYKPIGGYHIASNVKPLPQSLKKILDTAEHGVIYFSMGSNLKSKDIPHSLKEGFLNIFSSLKQTVLWKFEEVLPNLPSNVHIMTWAPQQSILAHPNCILFITHGGLLSTTEAVHFGKPIIGLPVFADQFANINRMVHKGFARKLELSYDMDKHLKVEIEEMLGNPKYAQKAKEWSFIYHDRPVTPGQELVHWVNHVIETGGSPHLRSAALLVPWYQKLYLDLLASVLGALIVAFVILRPVLKRAINNIHDKKGKKKKDL